MPMGFDGFMAPFGGGMPYIGYAPSPFDVPFGRMLPMDPFKTLISEDILKYKFPRKFSIPTFDCYFGVSEPIPHIRYF